MFNLEGLVTAVDTAAHEYEQGLYDLELEVTGVPKSFKYTASNGSEEDLKVSEPTEAERTSGEYTVTGTPSGKLKKTTSGWEFTTGSGTSETKTTISKDKITDYHDADISIAKSTVQATKIQIKQAIKETIEGVATAASKQTEKLGRKISG